MAYKDPKLGAEEGTEGNACRTGEVRAKMQPHHVNGYVWVRESQAEEEEPKHTAGVADQPHSQPQTEQQDGEGCK